MQKSGTSRVIGTLTATYICAALKSPACAIGQQRLSPSRLTTSTSWRSSEVINMEEMLLSLNGPWSNAACIGYCVMAMRNAGLSEKTQRKVLDELTRCFDDVSVEDAAQMKF